MSAMGRPRSPGNSDLPDNLYPHRKGWKYVRPSDGQPVYWPHASRDAAKAAARKLNDMLAPARPDLVQKALGGLHAIADAIKVFRTDDLPHRALSKRALAVAAGAHEITWRDLALRCRDMRQFGFAAFPEWLKARKAAA